MAVAVFHGDGTAVIRWSRFWIEGVGLRHTAFMGSAVFHDLVAGMALSY